MLLELPTGLPQPPLPTLRARNDPLLIKLKLRLDTLLRLPLGELLGGRGAQLLPGPGKELAPPLGRPQLLGQLITPRIAIQLILGLIGRPVLGHDLPGEPTEVTGRVRVRVARHPRAVNRDHLRPHQPRLTAQPQNLAEQLSQRLLVPAHEPRDRRVIRHQVAGNHPIGHVLTAITLDRPR